MGGEEGRSRVGMHEKKRVIGTNEKELSRSAGIGFKLLVLLKGMVVSASAGREISERATLTGRQLGLVFKILQSWTLTPDLRSPKQHQDYGVVVSTFEGDEFTY
ncbi:hypothetical protein Tco_1458420 [Tanacetum coccineum]